METIKVNKFSFKDTVITEWDLKDKDFDVILGKDKQNNIDEEKKAHPLTVLELSTLLNALSSLHPFFGAMLRLALVVGFIGCFRISEVLRPRWNDIQLVSEGKGRYLSTKRRSPVCAFVDSTTTTPRSCVTELRQPAQERFFLSKICDAPRCGTTSRLVSRSRADQPAQLVTGGRRNYARSTNWDFVAQLTPWWVVLPGV
ncbi:hypothetical protein H257_18975 [Aphanomyces astaci]|uniref:Uncharacterized protein n=1 Tax=Aphanomyces astaci TaxID=112090 RepID=W4FB09_APHAT|nr:hypothetical protein H257_18975 [Aphanomyces astaci]ETV64089.1 hypothetical protein H257_18975 [Aphanomyces astaci]|eukprot:XP_009846428.1 hypothetical protein H257_18975 [Aphanomyces astaci]